MYRIVVLAFFLYYINNIDSLPTRILQKLKDKGYILVDPKVGAIVKTEVTKDFGGPMGDRCAFHYVIDSDTSRIPVNLKVAVLKNPTSERDCMELTYEFPVLEQCVGCDSKDRYGIIYKISKQTIVIGFTPRKLDE